MENKKNALIAGATGLVGGALLKKMVDSGEYDKIYVLTRKEFAFNHPQVIIKEVDFDQLAYYRDDIHVDDVFCCLGTTLKKAGSKAMFYKIDHDFVINFAEFGLRMGGNKFVLITALGANRKSTFYYNRVKGAVEEDVAQLGFESIVICRPGMLLGERIDNRPLEKAGQVLSKWITPLLVGKLKYYRPIKAEKVADSMIKAAREDFKGIKILSSYQLQHFSSSYFSEEKNN